MSEILGNIYGMSVAIVFGTVVFGTVFFSTFWRLLSLVFWRNVFQNLISMFSFYPENSRAVSRKTYITQALLVAESCLTPHWVTFLIFYRLVYDKLSHLNDLILAWSTSLCQKFSHQNSRLVYEIFPFLKQVVRVIQFSDMLIGIEILLWN